MGSEFVVVMLLTCTRKSLPVSALSLETVRVGFPTATIKVYLNAPSSEVVSALYPKIIAAQAQMIYLNQVHHAEWLKDVINEHHDAAKLVILDGDCIFWRNCEWFEFNEPIAGYLVPKIWNEFTGCVSLARLHTSFLVIRPGQLMRSISLAYASYKEHPWFDVELIKPQIVFQDKKPVYLDTLCNLCQAIEYSTFEEQHMECYDHINSGSFYDDIMERFSEKSATAFDAVHQAARSDFRKLRGLWREIDAYYKEKARA